MDEKVRKNYTLYLNLYGNDIEIIKGTLKEIDDFTTYFTNSNAMFKKMSDELNTNSYFFHIKSSKNTDYDVIYYNYRPILFDENINTIMTKLKEVDRNRLLGYIKMHTDAVTYVNTPISESIPVVRLYKALMSGNAYYRELDNYVKGHYNALRSIVVNVLKDTDDMKKTLDARKKDEISNICKSKHEIIHNIYSKYKLKDTEYDEIISETENSDDDQIMNAAFDIVNNSLLNDEEKRIELDMIFDDAEKCNQFVLEYMYKNNNGATHGKINR